VALGQDFATLLLVDGTGSLVQWWLIRRGFTLATAVASLLVCPLWGWQQALE